MEGQEYFEQMIKAQFDTVHHKLDTQIMLQKIANGRTSKLEDKVEEIEKKYAHSKGHWSAINKVETAASGLLGGILGYVANKIF